MRRKVEYIFDSKKGLNRKKNKDRFFSWFENSNFVSYFAVFDGVSSSSGALGAINVASKSIKRELINQYKEKIFEPIDLVYAANDDLINSKIENPYTTITLLAIPADVRLQSLVCNVGDTRLYSVTRQYIEKITEGHAHPQHDNILTQCLGMSDICPEQKIVIDNFTDGLTLLICTDGFYKHVKDDWLYILSSCFKKNIYGIKKKLSKVIEKSEDDATYLLVKVHYV